MRLTAPDTLSRHLATRSDIAVFAFDLFDTLLARLVPPEYVKVLVAAYVRHRHADTAAHPLPPLADVYRQRRAAEDALKTVATAAGDDPEYRHAAALRDWLSALGLPDPAIAADVARFEQELEISVSFVHDPVAAAMRDLHARGRRVILVSDNYFSEDQLRALLAPTGLLPAIAAIHVSSTTCRRKDSGRLFAHVLQQESVRAADVLHIGDNPHSDDAVPRRLGLATLPIEIPGEAARRRALEALLPTDPPPATIDLDRLEAALALTTRARHAPAAPPAVAALALALVAPVAAYLDRLMARAESLRAPTVYFLAREGHLLRELFDRAAGGRIASAYVHASRVATHTLAVPDLTRDELERAFDSLVAHEICRVSARQLLAFYELDTPAGHAILADHAIRPAQRFDVRDPSARDTLARPFLDPRLRAAYAAARTEREARFAAYLRQLGLTDSAPILMADIGWAGSMQTFIADFLRARGSTAPVHGYYFGYDRLWELRKGVQRERPDLAKDGWVCLRDDADPVAGLIVSRIVLELIATAPHGTTCGYARPDANGPVMPDCAWLPGEQRQFESRIAPIQQVLRDAFARTWPLRRLLTSVMSAADRDRAAAAALARFLAHPPAAVARYFVPTALYDNHFGTRRRLAFGPGMWWGEAVAALGPLGWPWRAAHRLHRLAPHVREALHRTALCLSLYGPRATLHQLAHRLARGAFLIGTDFAITAQYRFRRTPRPEPAAATPTRVLFVFHDSPDEDAIRAAIPLLPRDPAGTATALYRTGSAQYNLARLAADNACTVEALTPAEANTHLRTVDRVVTTTAAVRFDADFLAHVGAALARTPAADLLYTDNDSRCGRRYARPRFKPDWSPEYFLEFDYIGPVVVLRRHTLGDAPLDFIARIEQQGLYAALLETLALWQSVVHVPAVLVHAPYATADAPPAVRARAGQALYGHAGAQLLPAISPPPAEHRQPNTGHLPPVSIVIPFRNRAAYLKRCLDSLARHTPAGAYELLLVDNGSDEPALRRYLDSRRGEPHVRILRDDRPFNYARLNNDAVAQARHPLILLLNNDTEFLAPGWFDALRAHAMRPEVGGVGARLLYPNRTIQHAGVVFDFTQAYPAAHIFHRAAARDGGYERRLQTTQQYSAVTAACFMLRRDVFDAVGGFDASFEVAYNDLDLCCRIRARGLRLIWTPAATLLHHENVSRGNPLASDRDRDERDRFRARWAPHFPQGDPCYTPHLHLGGAVKNAP